MDKKKGDGGGNAAAGNMSEPCDFASPTLSRRCAVCLDPFLHPISLPCGHKFCFLCVKGVAFHSLTCPYCRAPIPSGLILHPPIVAEDQKAAIKVATKSCSSVEAALPACTMNEQNSEFHWFYKGRQGWWQYDERTENELEVQYHVHEQQGEHRLMIAGHLYVIDFDRMMQYRIDDPRRRRQIRRDTTVLERLGIAGLPCNNAARPAAAAQTSPATTPRGPTAGSTSPRP